MAGGGGPGRRPRAPSPGAPRPMSPGPGAAPYLPGGRMASPSMGGTPLGRAPMGHPSMPLPQLTLQLRDVPSAGSVYSPYSMTAGQSDPASYAE